MKKLILLFVCIVSFNIYIHASSDEPWANSTQYILDYATGERQYFDDYMDESIWFNLRINLDYINDESGATIEWTIENAFFTNFISWAWDGRIVDENIYDWEIFMGNVPSDYNMKYDYFFFQVQDAISLPGSKDNFTVFENKTLDDVDITVLNFETIDIGQTQLAKYYYPMYDETPLKLKTEQESSSEEFLPIDIYHKVYDKRDPKYLSIQWRMGYYKPDTWDLRAVTKLKYHVSNARYKKPPMYIGTNIITDTDKKEKIEYYNLSGIRIDCPVKGQLYIKKQGSNTKKIIY